MAELPRVHDIGAQLEAEAKAAEDWPLDSRSWYEITDGKRSMVVLGQSDAVSVMATLNRRDGEKGVVWRTERLVRASEVCADCYEKTLPFRPKP